MNRPRVIRSGESIDAEMSRLEHLLKKVKPNSLRHRKLDDRLYWLEKEFNLAERAAHRNSQGGGDV